MVSHIISFVDDCMAPGSWLLWCMNRLHSPYDVLCSVATPHLSCPDHTNLSFRLVPTVKLGGIMLINRCCPAPLVSNHCNRRCRWMVLGAATTGVISP